MLKSMKKAADYAARNPVNASLSILSILVFMFLPSKMAIFTVLVILCFVKALAAGKTLKRTVFIILGAVAASCIGPSLNFIFKVGLVFSAILMLSRNKKMHDNVIYMSKRE